MHDEFHLLLKYYTRKVDFFSPDFRTKLQFKYSVLSQPKTISFHLVSLGKNGIFLNGKERVMKKICMYIYSLLFEISMQSEDTECQFHG